MWIVRSEVASLRGDMGSMRGDMASMRDEMRQRFDTAMLQSRAMFEETLSRIALLGEHRRPRRRKR